MVDPLLNIALDGEVVTYGGERLRVAPLVHRVLALFLRNTGKVVPLAELGEHFDWEAPIVSNNAKVAVCKARAALKDVGARVRIRTLYGEGYRLEVIE